MNITKELQALFLGETLGLKSTEEKGEKEIREVENQPKWNMRAKISYENLLFVIILKIKRNF